MHYTVCTGWVSSCRIEEEIGAQPAYALIVFQNTTIPELGPFYLGVEDHALVAFLRVHQHHAHDVIATVGVTCHNIDPVPLSRASTITVQLLSLASRPRSIIEPVDRALPTSRPAPKPVSINGVEYPSIQAAADAFKVSRHVLRIILNAGITKLEWMK